MTPTSTKDDAVAALRDIEKAKGRAGALRNYSGAAAPLIVWGLVWMAGNAVAHFRPEMAGPVWATGIGLGVLASVLAGMKAKSGPGSVLLTILWLAASLAAGFGGAYALTGEVAAFGAPGGTVAISLAVAAAYVLAGLRAGWWFSALGLALGAAIVGGRLWFDGPFELWMAWVCGGMLIVTGLWMRRV